MTTRSERYPKRLLRKIICGTNWCLITRCKRKKVKFLSTSIASKDNNGETEKHTKRRDTPYIK
jgi:hypothetical protein